MANKRGTEIDPGRMTKAERKDAGRRQRIEIERRMARARRNRWIALAVAVIVVAGGAVFVITRPKSASTSADPVKLLSTSASGSRAAGCDSPKDVGAYQPESSDQAHIGTQGGPATMPALSTYATVPPASGPHNQIPLNAGMYSSPPPIDEAIHSLEHGAAIVWYAPNVSGAELTKIQDFYDGSSVGSRVIVAPYDYPDQGVAGSLPAGTEMALVAWHYLEQCSQVNLAAAFGFTARYAAPPFAQEQYLGKAPEPGAAI